MSTRRKALLATVGAVLLLPLSECALRLTESDAPFADLLMERVLNPTDESVGTTAPHPLFGYTLPAGSGNVIGFRAPPPTAVDSLPVGTQRILLLGDGNQLSPAFENELRAAATKDGVELEILDYSLPGYNTVQALAVGHAIVPHLLPQKILIGLSLDDDPLANTLVTVDEGQYLSLEGSRDALRDELIRRLDLGGRLALERRWALGPGASRLRNQLAEDPAVVLRALLMLRALDDVAVQNDASLTVLLIPPDDALQSSLAARLSGATRMTRTYREALELAGFDTVSLQDEALFANTVWTHLSILSPN